MSVTVSFPGPSTSSFGEVNKEVNFNSLDGGFGVDGFGGGGIKDDKPHLYTKGLFVYIIYLLFFFPCVRNIVFHNTKMKYIVLRF